MILQGAIPVHSYVLSIVTLCSCRPTMDKALAIAERSTLGLLTLITGATPPKFVRELLLPPLDLDMSAPVDQSQSEPSSIRMPPYPIHTQMTTDATLSMDDTQSTDSSPTSAVYDATVIPPSHDARTLVLCFDGTGDQFDADVRSHFLFPGYASGHLAHRTPLCCYLQNSNIVQFFSMLKKDDKSQQLVYYQVRGVRFTFMRCGGSNSAL